MKNKMRLNLQITAFLFIVTINETFQSDYTIHSDENKALHGHIISNTTTSGIEPCLQLCLANCLCKSFQICHQTECQLCSSNKYLHPTAMKDDENCSTFNFETDIPANQCGATCISSPINCCLTSNPCLHGGTCVPLRSYGSQRYSCKCPVHYRGKRCEILNCSPGYGGKSCTRQIKSCTDVAGKDPGVYTILDQSLNAFQVYCDFDKDFSWTLVQSYALRMNSKFLWTPYLEDSPKKKNNPNWLLHRLGRPRMTSIRMESTKWRITCSYDTTDGVDYQDYVWGSISEVDLLNFEGGRCIKVDYISVRGKNCSNCTAYAFQKAAIFHFPSQKGNCEFQTTGFKQCASMNPIKKFESSFGFYACANEQHLCSSYPNATTQTWFGAKHARPATTHKQQEF